MATEADFKARYPEFEALATVRYTALSAEAERDVGDTWGDQRDDVVMLTIAAMLAPSPSGRSARLDDPRAASTYEKRLNNLKRRHAWAHLRTS